MAGFLIAQEGNVNGIQFHVGEPNLKNRLNNANMKSRIMTLQLDGEEMEAALWGLEQWKEPGSQVPPDKKLSEDAVLVSVVTNAIAFNTYQRLGREVSHHPESGSPMVHLAMSEIIACADVAKTVLAHIDYYKEHLDDV